MKDRETSRKRTLTGIRKHLALGVALPGMLAMSISVQAQSTKLPSSKKSLFGASTVTSPSKSSPRVELGSKSAPKTESVLKKPGMLESRTSRSSSIGLSAKPQTRLNINAFSGSSLSQSKRPLTKPPAKKPISNRGLGSISNPGLSGPVMKPKPGVRDGGSGKADLGNVINGLGRGISPPPAKGGLPEIIRTRPSLPEIGKKVPRVPPKVSGPISKFPLDLNGRIKTPAVPDLGRLGRVVPDAKGGILDIKPETLPRITEGNRGFENILGKVTKIETKPLDIKELRKELPKLTLLDNEKLQPELKLEQQKMVAGARQSMRMRFGFGARCNWWADLLCRWHWRRHGCHWTDICVMPGYWTCWTPCHYRIVWCPTIHGHVRSAWYFGIESFLIPDVHALGVHEVSPFSPAAMAGLQPGDMILSVNGYAFDNETVLPHMIQTSGGILDLEVYREGMDAPVHVQVRLRRLRITSF